MADRHTIESAARYPTDAEVDAAVAFMEGKGWTIKIWPDDHGADKWLWGAKFTAPAGHDQWGLLRRAVIIARELGWDTQEDVEA